jgi:type I restriction enzyme S subunit
MSVEVGLAEIPYVKIDDITSKTKYSCVGGPFGSSLSRKHYVEEQAVPVIRGTNLSGDQFIDDGFVFVSEEKGDELHRNLAFPGDIVFTQRGTLGQVAIIPKDVKYKRYVVSQSQMKLAVNENIADSYYVYSYFRSSEAKRAIGNNAIIGGVPHINLGILKAIEIPLPSLNIQKKISKILKSLDEKIELNRQTNQTLEQMAQAIFKCWFVDFEPTRAKIAAKLNGQDPERAAMAAISGKAIIELEQLSPDTQQQLRSTAGLFPDKLVDSELGEIPEGWAVRALDEIAHYQNGMALQNFRPENENDYLPVLKIAQLKKGFADGVEKASPNIKTECIVENGDVVFSWSGSLIVDVWCGGKAALNQHLFKVTSKHYPKWFYYYWTKNHLESFQQIAADKAVTMGHIKREHLTAAKCAVPNLELQGFKSIGIFLDKQIEHRFESFTLQDLRDSLLPKLLSGELLVDATQKDLDAARCEI